MQIRADASFLTPCHSIILQNWADADILYSMTSDCLERQSWCFLSQTYLNILSRRAELMIAVFSPHYIIRLFWRIKNKMLTSQSHITRFSCIGELMFSHLTNFLQFQFTRAEKSWFLYFKPPLILFSWWAELIYIFFALLYIRLTWRTELIPAFSTTCHSMILQKEIILTFSTPYHPSSCRAKVMLTYSMSFSTEMMLTFPTPCHSIIFQNRADAYFPNSMPFMTEMKLTFLAPCHSIILQNRAGVELLYLEWFWLPLLTGSAIRRLLQLKRKVKSNQWRHMMIFLATLLYFSVVPAS